MVATSVRHPGSWDNFFPSCQLHLATLDIQLEITCAQCNEVAVCSPPMISYLGSKWVQEDRAQQTWQGMTPPSPEGWHAQARGPRAQWGQLDRAAPSWRPHPGLPPQFPCTGHNHHSHILAFSWGSGKKGERRKVGAHLGVPGSVGAVPVWKSSGGRCHLWLKGALTLVLFY